jgi:hypothetical protein
LWVGSRGSGARDGIFRSSDGGASWQRVNDQVTPLCLRHRGDTLYICADDGRDGFALGFSRDGGEHFQALLSWKELIGPEGCPAGTPGRLLCERDWPRLRATLSSVDAGITAIDAGAADAGAGDAGSAAAGSGCSCNTSRGGRSQTGVVILIGLVVAAAKAFWRQRRHL